MKKILLALVAVLSMTTISAQEEKREQRERPQMTPEAMTERMAKGLELTEEQKAKVLELNKAYEDMFKGPGMRMQRPEGERKARPEKVDRDKVRKQMTEEQKASMKKMFEKREEYNAKLKEILTEAQMKKYNSMRQHMRHGQGPRGGRGGHHRQN
jgi:Spy/CpxP family protein refolding chaperone